MSFKDNLETTLFGVLGKKALDGIRQTVNPANAPSSNSSGRIESVLKKYTMVIALVAVFILFSFLTEGRLLYPQNMSNLLLQNS